MAKTKIVCTIGPASESPAVLLRMVKAGMSVARINMSHGSHEEQKKKIETLKEVREKTGVPFAIMIDTKGPEYRIGIFKDGGVTLNEGDTFTFTTDDIVGDETKVSVSYKNLHNEMSIGDRILLNNGLLEFEVESIVGKDIVCKVMEGGDITDRKSMAFPGKVLKQEFLSEHDKKDLLFAIENDVDLIACSFVSTREDIASVRDFLDQHGGEDIDLIAKIENQAGIDNIEQIVSLCEGVMLGRGDMGVEIPYVKLPSIQKKLIDKCRMLGKRVITATEMLESMIHNPRPTRAEVSDVANAVYDGTSAVMLSAETAVGKYPVQTVVVMNKIVEATENAIDYKEQFLNTKFTIQSNLDALSHSTCGVAIGINAKCIAVCTRSGKTARMISRFRPPVPILAIAHEEKVVRKMALSWGIIPVLAEKVNTTDDMFINALNIAKQKEMVKKGDNIVITAGSPLEGAKTNLIKVETVED